MLKIRLRRVGRIHEPIYRIIVTEDKAAAQGNFIAQVGHYNPKTKAITLNKEEILDWMNKGAKPSNTLSKLLKKEKMKHKSIVIHKTKINFKKEDKKENKTPKTDTPTEENTTTIKESPEVIAETKEETTKTEVEGTPEVTSETRNDPEKVEQTENPETPVE